MAQGAGKFADGVYNRRPWTAPAEAAMPPQEYIGPFQSNQERLLSQSLAAWSMSAAEIQEYVRPPLPQIQLFPARFGYTDTEIGIEDLINLPRRVATTQRVESDFSQTPNTQESSSTNSLGGTI
jgi:hypothetical protein